MTPQNEDMTTRAIQSLDAGQACAMVEHYDAQLAFFEDKENFVGDNNEPAVMMYANLDIQERTLSMSIVVTDELYSPQGQYDLEEDALYPDSVAHNYSTILENYEEFFTQMDNEHSQITSLLSTSSEKGMTKVQHVLNVVQVNKFKAMVEAVAIGALHIEEASFVDPDDTDDCEQCGSSFVIHRGTLVSSYGTVLYCEIVQDGGCYGGEYIKEYGEEAVRRWEEFKEDEELVFAAQNEYGIDE